MSQTDLIMWELKQVDKVYLLLANSGAKDSVVLKQVDVEEMPSFKICQLQTRMTHLVSRTTTTAWAVVVEVEVVVTPVCFIDDSALG